MFTTCSPMSMRTPINTPWSYSEYFSGGAFTTGTLGDFLIVGTGSFVSESGQSGYDRIYAINVDTSTVTELTYHQAFSGATFDSVINRVLFTSTGPSADGSNLYAATLDPWTVEYLGTIHTSAGELRIDGLAMTGGILYGDHGITDPSGDAGLYSIDLTTFLATHLFDFPNFAISGIDADPVSGKIYAVDDDPLILSLVEIGLDGTITPVAAYPEGEIDIDGLAISPDRKAYLIPDQTGSIFVYNLTTEEYDDPLTTPWTYEDLFSAGAFVAYPALDVDPVALSSTQLPNQSLIRESRD